MPVATWGGGNSVVIMFMDDMGYADIGPFGAKGYPTPHLDRMAGRKKSLRTLRNAQAVCSASLIFYELLQRAWESWEHLARNQIGKINPDEVTIAEICKQEGLRDRLLRKVA